MPFLRINGIQVAVADATAMRKLTRQGKRARGFRGQLRDMRRGIRRSWEMETVPMNFADAEPMIRIINGEGHHVDFADGLQASTGLNPRAGNANVILRPATMGAWGRGVMQARAGLIPLDSQIMSYDIQAREQDWTVIMWTHATGVWTGSALRSDGIGYRAGVVNANALKRGVSPDGVFLTQADGVITLWLDTTAPANVHMDDLVLLPYALSDSQMSAVTTYTAKFGMCPVLNVTGDMIGNDVFCVGEVKDVKVINKGAMNNAKVIRFTLSELQPAFLAGLLSGGAFRAVAPGAPLWWYESNDIDGALNSTLSDGSALSSWRDKGSRAQNLTQATGAKQPIFRRIGQAGKLNYFPSVQFDGTDDQMESTSGVSIGTGKDITVAAVARADSTAAGSRLLNSGIGAQRAILVNASNWQVIAASQVSHPIETVVVGEWVIMIAVFRTNGTTTQFLANNVNAQVNAGSSSSGLTGMRIGGTTSFFWNGHVVELLVWDDASYGTPADIAEYLQRKYAELPQ